MDEMPESMVVTAAGEKTTDKHKREDTERAKLQLCNNKSSAGSFGAVQAYGTGGSRYGG